MAKHTGTQKNIRFSDEELALLDRMTEKHETMKAAILAGLRALEGHNDLTQDQVLDWIKRNTK
jgi:hypothetical protein